MAVSTVGLFFALLVIYQVKHWLADYPLQGQYMLGKFKPGWDFVPPLSAHAGVHGAFTFTIACLFCWGQLGFQLELALFDFVVHFTMDRIKAGPRILGRWKPDNKLFWWALGFDQMIHHLTHYVCIYAILRAMGQI